jgi:hypothetical protein
MILINFGLSSPLFFFQKLEIDPTPCLGLRNGSQGREYVTLLPGFFSVYPEGFQKEELFRRLF